MTVLADSQIGPALTERFTEPVHKSTISAFENFVGIPAEPTASTDLDASAVHELNSSIGLTGPGDGKVVVSVSKQVACGIAGLLFGEEPQEVDSLVLDMVGEFANMIGGAAKKELDHLGFKLGLPEPIEADDVATAFPPGSEPVTLQFRCQLGDISVHVGLVGKPDQRGPSDVAEGERKQLLIIDDDELFRALLKKHLVEHYDIETATTGREGFDKIQEAVPDVVLADVHMPDWSGVKFVQEARALPNLATVPLIMISADASRKTVLEAFNAGANDYILKHDFTQAVLLGKLERAISLFHKN